MFRNVSILARFGQAVTAAGLVALASSCGDVALPTEGADARPISRYGGTFANDNGPASNPKFGVVESGLAELDPNEIRKIAGLVRQSGAKFVRQTFYWHVFQPTAQADRWTGIFNQTAVNQANTFLSILADSGLSAYITLEGTPPWARNCPSDSVLPEHNNERTDCYQNFPPAQSHWLPYYYWVRDMVALFPSVQYWGIWNEPNHATYLQPLPDTTWRTAYWHMFVWASDAIHAAGKNIAGPELGGDGGSIPTNTQQNDMLWFVENLGWRMNSGDKLTFHLYNSTTVLDQQAEYFRWAANVNSLSANEIWVTEGGLAAGWMSDDQEDQAAAVTARYQWTLNNSRGVTKHFWMPYSRAAVMPTETAQGYWDITTNPPTPRLAYDCFQALGRGLSLPSYCTSGLQTTIAGPMSAPAGGSCEWNATTNVPDNPTITWKVNGSTVGTGPSVWVANYESFWLEAVATNGRGHSKTDARYVTVSGSGPCNL